MQQQQWEKNIPGHVNIQKQWQQQIQQDNKLTQGKTYTACSKVPPAKYTPHRTEFGFQISWLASKEWLHYVIKPI